MFNEEAGAINVATSLLMRFHPLEPEMALYLCGRKHRQWRLSTHGGNRDFVAPCPDDVLPDIVRKYERTAWARGHISVTDLERKPNTEGDIVSWLRAAHQK